LYGNLLLKLVVITRCEIDCPHSTDADLPNHLVAAQPSFAELLLFLFRQGNSYSIAKPAGLAVGGGLDESPGIQIRGEQRFDLGPDRLVARAGLIQIGRASGRIEINRSLE